MWISKKKYNELIKQKDNFERIAFDAVQQNSRLLDQMQEMNETDAAIIALCHQLQNEVDRSRAAYKKLEGECSELRNKNGTLTAQLIETEKWRDYYRNLLDEINEEENWT